MNFIKKNFEKVIFVFLLLAFVVLFGLQAFSVINQQDQNPEQKLNISLGRADYKSEEFNEKNAAEIRFEPKADDNLKMDLLVPPALAKCPFGAHMIPVGTFPEKDESPYPRCPFCGRELKDVPSRLAARDTVDSDGDGIPDVEERKNGLDPNNPADGNDDFDKDGFTNREEIQAGLDFKNPESRPGYEKKLSVINGQQKKLGFQLKSIRTAKTGVEDWKLKIKYEIKDKKGKIKFKTSKDLVIGDDWAPEDSDDNFVVDNIEVPDVNAKHAEKTATVNLKRDSDGAVIPLRLGQDAVEPNKELTFGIDLPFMEEKEIKVSVGKEFRIGNDKVGFDRLRVISADLDSDVRVIKVENITKKITTEILWPRETENSEPGSEADSAGNSPRTSKMPDFTAKTPQE